MSVVQAATVPDRRGAAAWLGFAAFVTLAIVLVLVRSYPSDFDELEHVAYAAFLQETHAWQPMFEAMLDLPRDSLTHWSTQPNYLGHPSPFYWYETLFLHRDWPLGEAITAMRLGSAALAAGGVGLALWAGARHFGRDRLALLAFVALVALCPKLLAVTAQVTNDALGVLAGGLALWAARGEAQRPRLVRAMPDLLAAALALALACWAKPNAGLAVGAALGLHAVLRWRVRLWLLPALAMGALVGSVPYWFIVAKYGALVPKTVEQLGGVHQIAGPLNYLPAFLFTLAYTFCFDQTGTWPVPGFGAVIVVALVWALVLATAVGGVMALRNRAGDSARVVAMVGPLAFLIVLPIHFWFSAHSLGGSLPAASFRYYLPIWPFMAYSIGYAVETGGPPLRAGLLGLVALTLGVGWLSP